jgi:murein DD-endopeptidase MepM/ murein hydrolase activator NlpD
MIIPVKGAGKNSYHPESFWFYPWGKSVVHKGVDIFANEGTDVIAATGELVIFKGELGMGGKALVILGPKWRFHYYAHLKSHNVSLFSIVAQKEKIGEVGTTGNAKGKPPHLHYTLATLFPYPWRIDNSPQGYKKMFFLNPIEHFDI